MKSEIENPDGLAMKIMATAIVILLVAALVFLLPRAVFAQNDRAFIESQIRRWQQVVDQNPNDYDTLTAIGVAYGKVGQNDKAVTYFKKAIAINPNYGEAYLLLCTAYSFLGRPKESIEAGRKAIALSPNDALAHGKLGATLGKNGYYQESITELKKAIQLHPKMADAHFALGLAYLGVDDRKSATDEASVLAKLDQKQSDQLQHLIDLGRREGTLH